MKILQCYSFILSKVLYNYIHISINIMMLKNCPGNQQGKLIFFELQ